MSQDGRPSRTFAQAIPEVLGGIRERYRWFEPRDFQEFAGLFDTAGAFADRLVEPGSVHSAAAHAVLTREWALLDKMVAQGNRQSGGGIANLGGLALHLATAIGATAYRRACEPDWGGEMISSPGGYIFTTVTGRVFLDAEVMADQREIWLSEISVERRGGGLGSSVMAAIHDYAETKDLGVAVWKVVNHGFFSRFDWLVGNSDRNGSGYHSTFGPRAVQRPITHPAVPGR